MPSIEPTAEQLAAFLKNAPDDQPIVMINLLRFREQAVYPDGFDAAPCGGREAYRRYGERVIQHLVDVGARPIWMGDVKGMVIGPPGESWDEALLVQYPSKQAFLQMVGKPEYQRDATHRSAALADSRLICTVATT
jgi:uncharacterized protein (DUF1330 family)